MKIDEKRKEDLEFSRRIKKAWKEYDKGKFKTIDADEFIKKLKNGK